jgi:hypothetical protein
MPCWCTPEQKECGGGGAASISVSACHPPNLQSSFIHLFHLYVCLSAFNFHQPSHTFFVFGHLSVSLSICPFVCLSDHPLVSQSTNLPFCLSICSFVCLSVRPSACLCIHRIIFLSVHLYLHLFALRLACLLTWLSNWLSVILCIETLIDYENSFHIESLLITIGW